MKFAWLILSETLAGLNLAIYDLNMVPGSYAVSFDGRGMYIYRMTAGSFIASRRMLLRKEVTQISKEE